ncbi:MAG: DNA polymerase III subunit gamma/tau [Alphaproteobacteria bacterium]
MTEDTSKIPYRVLALKYRPQNFDELIGQEALVRTLTNAIETGRIAHAFMLTGVRGVGKTTTARIIAKALNYKGPDGQGEPTTKPADDCDICRAIAEDRHPDVIEMDAASRTGVEDIREILDGVRYAPTEARYKIYIIDEVHMLSKNAFNALLKTLEEPPPHVKFIFATTEIRKVPITVLSRCQRFDLRRVDVETLKTHFESICEKEQVSAEDEALSIICRAADGSVRDGLSLLDQAIALSDGKVTTEQVKAMLGLGDRGKNIDLLDHILSGNTAEALQIMDEIYAIGGDPSVLIQDLLDCVHTLTKLRAVPNMDKTAQGLAQDEISRLKEMAEKLTMPTLAKAWQLLLKGLSEVNMASNPQSAAEMVIIRLAYAADLPDPSDLLKKLKDGSGSVSASSPSGGASAPASLGTSAPVARGNLSVASSNNSRPSAATARKIEDKEESDPDFAPLPENIETMEQLVELLEDADELVLSSRVFSMLHLVRLDQKEGSYRLDVRVHDTAPPSLLNDLSKTLRKITGKVWLISPCDSPGAPTLAQKRDALYEMELQKVKEHPLMKEVFELFPDAEIIDIKNPE